MSWGQELADGLRLMFKVGVWLILLLTLAVIILSIWLIVVLV